MPPVRSATARSGPTGRLVHGCWAFKRTPAPQISSVRTVGVLCGRTINAIGTLTGRVGYAWDRSLAYVKGGGAWTDTTYSVFGNTDALALGSGSTTLTTSGWTIGAGVEYAITDHWTTFAEYDHIGLPSVAVSFPTVAIINVSSIAVKQSADLFKLGVNYKFDFGP